MVQFRQDGRHQRCKVIDSIACCLNSQYRDRQNRQVLLKLQILVHGQEHVELRRGEAKKLAVLDARPSAALYRCNLVPSEQLSATTRKVFVKQDAHLP